MIDDLYIKRINKIEKWANEFNGNYNELDFDLHNEVLFLLGVIEILDNECLEMRLITSDLYKRLEDQSGPTRGTEEGTREKG